MVRTEAKQNRLPIHSPNNARWKTTAHTMWTREFPTHRAHPSGSFQIGGYHRGFRDSGCITTQAQRPGARDATTATATLAPGSLQRMVGLHFHCCVPLNSGVSLNVIVTPSTFVVAGPGRDVS